MHASKRTTVATVALDEFLSRLRKALIECSKAIIPASSNVPQWAASCSHLLYSAKGVPPESSFDEPGKLYISCTEDPTAVMLVGKARDQKPIKRKLKISTKRASNLITITSEHFDFITGKCFTCTGVGQNFKSALDHYFLSSKLDKNYTYKTDGNVQQKGDAFLLPKVLTSRGNEGWVEEIVDAVRKVFLLVPEKKHGTLAMGIEKAVSTLDQFLKARENEKIVNFHDARLWLIVESICKHFDPLGSEEEQKRKSLRDYLIAECCRKLMNAEDIAPSLDSYFQAMNMHQELMQFNKAEDSIELIKVIVEAYVKDNLIPEVEGHRERIKDYYERVKKHQK